MIKKTFVQIRKIRDRFCGFVIALMQHTLLLINVEQWFSTEGSRTPGGPK